MSFLTKHFSILKLFFDISLSLNGYDSSDEEIVSVFDKIKGLGISFVSTGNNFGDDNKDDDFNKIKSPFFEIFFGVCFIKL